MLALVAALLVVAAFAAAVHHYAPAPADRWGVLLERYRPHAPMSDWTATEYEAARHYSDLAAAAARQRPDTPIPTRRSSDGIPVSVPTPAQDKQSRYH